MSFYTSLFQDLKALCALDGQDVVRVDPEIFLQETEPRGSYMNLVTLDMELRRRVSQHLDQQDFERFSLISDHNVILGNVGAGSFLCPMINAGSNCILERDVICMGHAQIGHQTKISQGTIMSPGVIVSGSVSIGQFCYLRTGVKILDKLNIVDDVDILAGSMIRKDIKQKGRYLVNSKGVLKQI